MMEHNQVLIIGSGAREHAIAWKLAQSKLVKKIYVSPGNAGTWCLDKTENVALDLNHFQAISDWCIVSGVGLVVVGPEVFLADGIADHLNANGIDCFGPVKSAAQIESSKDFAKHLMQDLGIPTARFQSFQNNPEAAKQHIREACYPALVVKASGLAMGKGVIVAEDKEEACTAVDQLSALPAGETIVVEELLVGEEVTILAFCDGRRAVTMLPVQDYKRLSNGDTGPNTGGLGAYCPSPVLTDDQMRFVRNDIIYKVLNALNDRGITYKGVLYAGMMLTKDGPRVLEFNCRFGDPEAEVVLPLLKTDLYLIMESCIRGKLDAILPLQWEEESVAVGVVIFSKGYPGVFQRGFSISGIETHPSTKDVKNCIFHAGTTIKDDKLVTNGGRVFCVVAIDESISLAVLRSQQLVKHIHFNGAQFRTDIAFKGIAKELLVKGRSTYKKAGVNIDAASHFIRIIKQFVESTHRTGCVGTIGGFGGLFDLRDAGYTDPLLVSGTDGVGTKLKIAQKTGHHETIGIDLVAMCANDILAEGGEPLFFLDYLACGQLNVDVSHCIIHGITEGCLVAGCALTGGETAEMPGVYPIGEYDLAGFMVGAVDRALLLPRKQEIVDGDLLIGLASSGIHSNGFSLVRHIVDQLNLNLTSTAPFSPTQTLGEALLTPTRIYVKHLLPILKNGRVKAVAHITGGGLIENIPRVLPDSVSVTLDASQWFIPPVFAWLSTMGEVSEDEMLRTFNCGLGMVLIVGCRDADEIIQQLPPDYAARVVGCVKPRLEGTSQVKVVQFAKAIGPLMLPYVESLIKRKHLPLKRVAVLISGSGTNLQSLIEHTSRSSANKSTKITLVISNVPQAEGLRKAERAGIKTLVIPHKNFTSRVDFDRQIHAALVGHNIELVCLAGFMRILTPEFTQLWSGKLLNIHPSLLPAFKGTRPHQQALNAGVRLTGCTVHFVQADVDSGPIISQAAVAVMDGDTEETLSERVKQVEHQIYPEALELVASGSIRLDQCGKIERLLH